MKYLPIYLIFLVNQLSADIDLYNSTKEDFIRKYFQNSINAIDKQNEYWVFSENFPIIKNGTAIVESYSFDKNFSLSYYGTTTRKFDHIIEKENGYTEEKRYYDENKKNKLDHSIKIIYNPGRSKSIFKLYAQEKTEETLCETKPEFLFFEKKYKIDEHYFVNSNCKSDRATIKSSTDLRYIGDTVRDGRRYPTLQIAKKNIVKCTIESANCKNSYTFSEILVLYNLQDNSSHELYALEEHSSENELNLNLLQEVYD